MDSITLIREYFPGAIAAILGLHAEKYAKELRFGLAFEAKASIELGVFLLNLDPGKDLLLLATAGEALVGSILVDGHTVGPEEAELRWFIVHAAKQTEEVESMLLEEALEFCRAGGFRRILFTTVRDSELAQRLIAHWKFQLVDAEIGRDWESSQEEQQFFLTL
jgi:GNAT superfamily N-acetyltransferase